MTNKKSTVEKTAVEQIDDDLYKELMMNDAYYPVYVNPHDTGYKTISLSYLDVHMLYTICLEAYYEAAENDTNSEAKWTAKRVMDQLKIVDPEAIARVSEYIYNFDDSHSSIINVISRWKSRAGTKESNELPDLPF